jgi:hypothetical protein
MMLGEKKMKQQKLKKAIERAFKEDSSVEDVFMMIYYAKYLILDNWTEIEDIIEDIFEERPDWYKVKKMMREDD